MNRAGVLCVGRVYCDLVFTDLPRLPTPGTETFAGGLSLHPGGGAAITAAYLAALGRPAHLAAHLPAAPFDERVATALDRLGVGRGLCRPAPEGADPQVTVAMARAADRAFLTRDSGPAVPRLEAGALRAAGIGHLHVGELKTLVEQPGLLDLARTAGLTVSLDCGWDDALSAGAGPLIDRADVFLPNAAEHDRLRALGLPARGRRATVVKRGADGSSVPGGPVVPAEPAEPVDATGAGDAFNAGFLHAWLEGLPMERCQREGNACGARAVAYVGGTAGAAAVRRMRLSASAAE